MLLFHTNTSQSMFARSLLYYSSSRTTQMSHPPAYRSPALSLLKCSRELWEPHRLHVHVQRRVYQYFTGDKSLLGCLFCLEPRTSRQRRRLQKPASLNKVALSKAAETHAFHKIRSPAKCSECDSYVFNGVECAQCGLSCHKKCLENTITDCSHSVSIN